MKHAEPTLASPESENASEAKDYIPEFLSPVSKLELARQYAAEEQKKRIEATNARLVNQMKHRSTKRKQTEDTVEVALIRKLKKTKYEDTKKTARSKGEQLADMEVESTRYPERIESQDVISTAYIESSNAETVSTQSDIRSQESHASNNLEIVDQHNETKELLRLARMRLDRLAANSLSNHSSPTSLQSPMKAAMQKEYYDEHSHSDPSSKQNVHDASQPLTNYHLKQMGYTGKINIYASIEDQQPQLQESYTSRVVVDADPTVHKRIDFQSPFPESDEIKEAYEDSDNDFVPYDTNDTKSTSSSTNSEDSMPSARRTSHSRLSNKSFNAQHKYVHQNDRILPQSSFFWVPIYIFSIFILILGLLLALDLFREYCDELEELFPFIKFP